MTSRFAPNRIGPAVLAVHLLGLLAGLVLTWSSLADIAGRRAAVAQTRDSLDHLSARIAALGQSGAGVAPAPAADPFVAGDSGTVAGANLQDRVVSAIRAAGGKVTSSQVDMTGATAVPPTVALSVSCDVPEPALQGLLYDLEAGTPFLFFDQISIQAATDDASDGEPASGGGPKRLKLSFVVSASWMGGGKS